MVRFCKIFKLTHLGINCTLKQGILWHQGRARAPTKFSEFVQ